jgi:hypothetical protein
MVMAREQILMAKKETFEEFFKKWGSFDNRIIRKAVAGWNSNTLLAMVESQSMSPVRTGRLQGSARRVRASVTPTGIKSSYIFGVPYAFKMEKGVNPITGKELNINTSINPKAQKGYGQKGIDKQEPFFMRDLNKVISQAWREI